MLNCHAVSDRLRFPAAPLRLSSQSRKATPLKTLLLILGVAALLMGLLWIGQGTGIVMWPASSFMLDQRPWALRGVVLAIVGLALILWSRRR